MRKISFKTGIVCGVLFAISFFVFLPVTYAIDTTSVKKDTFTLDKYIEVYVKNSPELVQDYNALKIAEIKFQNAIITLFLPSADFSAGTEITSKNHPGLHFNEPYGASLSVNWNIFNSGRDYLAYTQQKNILEIARLRFNNRIQEIVLSAINTFYDLKRKESLLEVAGRDLKDKEEQFEITQLLYKDGLKAYTDLLQSENSFKTAQLNMEREVLGYTSSLRNFNNQIGRDIAAPVKLDYEPDAAMELYSTSFEEDLQTAVSNRADINTEILNFQNEKINDKLTVMRNLPMLNAGFGLTNSSGDIFGSGANSTDYSAKLSLSVPIGFLWVDKYNDIRISKMDLINNYMRFENTFRQIKENIFNVRNNLKFQLASIEISKNNLKISEENLNIIRAKYADGNASSLDLFAAQDKYLSAQISDTNYRYDYQLSRYSYMRALGLDIYDDKKLVFDAKDFTDSTIKKIERDFLLGKSRSKKR